MWFSVQDEFFDPEEKKIQMACFFFSSYIIVVFCFSRMSPSSKRGKPAKKAAGKSPEESSKGMCSFLTGITVER